MLGQFIVNGIVAGSIYALVALGFAVIYQTTRFFHFAHGGVYTCGAYLAYFFIAKVGLPFYLSVTLSVIFTSLLGGLIEISVYRFLRRKQAPGIVLLLASLGLFIMLQNCISLFFGDDMKSIRNRIVAEGILIFDARVTYLQITILVVSLTLGLLTWAALYFTKMGTIIRTVANDSELSKIIGIDSDKVILSIFILGSALAAVASILIALDNDMTPNMGFNALLTAVVVVFVGGIDSIPGVILGSMFLGVVQHLGVWKLPTQWQEAITFSILILFLLLRPQGFLGKPVRKVTV